MAFHVLISVKQKIDLLAAPPNPRELDFQSQKVLRALKHGQVGFDENLQHYTEAIASFHSNTMEHNSSEHKETQSVIVNAVNQASRGKKRRDIKFDNWSPTPAQKVAQEAGKRRQNGLFWEACDFHTGSRPCNENMVRNFANSEA